VPQLRRMAAPTAAAAGCPCPRREMLFAGSAGNGCPTWYGCCSQAPYDVRRSRRVVHGAGSDRPSRREAEAVCTGHALPARSGPEGRRLRHAALDRRVHPSRLPAPSEAGRCARRGGDVGGRALQRRARRGDHRGRYATRAWYADAICAKRSERARRVSSHACGKRSGWTRDASDLNARFTSSRVASGRRPSTESALPRASVLGRAACEAGCGR
jgi:hypothetical protein